MQWLILSYVVNVVELLLIGGLITAMNPLVYVSVYYGMATAATMFSQKVLFRPKTPVKLDNIIANKNLVMAYVGGSLFGNSLWFLAAYLVGISTVTVLLIGVRILVTAYAIWFLKEKVRTDQVFAVGLSIGALIWFSLAGAGQVEYQGLGTLAGLVSCLGYFVETIARKRLIDNDVAPRKILQWRSAAHFVLFTAAALIIVGPSNIDFGLEPKLWVLIAITAVLGGVMRNLFTFYAMRTVSLVYYEVAESTKPVVVGGLAILLLGEVIADEQLLPAAMLVVASTYFFAPASFLRRHAGTPRSKLNLWWSRFKG